MTRVKKAVHRVAGPACAIALFACPTTMLAAQSVAAHAQHGGDQFMKQSTREQKRIHTEVHAACDGLTGDHFAAVRSAIEQAERRTTARGARLPNRKSSKRAPESSSSHDWELPSLVSYRYGRGVMEPIAGTSAARARAERRVPIELALLGMLPGSDRALAELEQRLDSDRSADAFAVFLESWRNGDETFYAALDRTAGTDAGVFFYDAMLGDFVSEIAATDRAAVKKLRKSEDATHRALHQAFLSYRQYRAFREAVALSMLLPPDVPLPQRLSRYEAKVPGTYSLREQVLMVLAINQQNAMTVADLIRESAAPLPVPLWSAHYDPFGSWNKIFVAAMPRMLETVDHTDAYLEIAIAARANEAARVRELAASLVGVAPLATGY